MKIINDHRYCDDDCKYLQDGRCSKYDEPIETVHSAILGDKFSLRCVECSVARKVELCKQDKLQQLREIVRDLKSGGVSEYQCIRIITESSREYSTVNL